MRSADAIAIISVSNITATIYTNVAVRATHCLPATPRSCPAAQRLRSTNALEAAAGLRLCFHIERYWLGASSIVGWHGTRRGGLELPEEFKK